MKNFIKVLTFVAVAINAPSTFAQEHLDLDLTSVDTKYIASLPQLADRQVEVTPAPQYAAVQPTAELKFSFASCAAQQFEAKVQEDTEILLVAVERLSDIDCYGPVQERDYSVQIASDMITKPIVVLNPLPLPRPSIRIPDQRYCTADFGVLYNPRLKKCATFTNGCQRHNLVQAGYASPKAGQCGL